MNTNIYFREAAMVKVNTLSAQDSAAPIDIEFEKIKIDARVNVTFEID